VKASQFFGKRETSQFEQDSGIIVSSTAGALVMLPEQQYAISGGLSRHREKTAQRHQACWLGTLTASFLLLVCSAVFTLPPWHSPTGSRLVYHEVQEVRVNVPVGAAAGTTLLVQGIGADAFFLTVPKGVHTGGTFLALLPGTVLPLQDTIPRKRGSQLKQRSLFSMLHSVPAPSENAAESHKFAAVMDAAAAASLRAKAVTSFRAQDPWAPLLYKVNTPEKHIHGFFQNHSVNEDNLEEEQHAIVVAVPVTGGANQGSVAVAEPVAWLVKTIASMPPGIKVRYKHRYSLSLSPLPPCLPPCLPAFHPPSLCH